jgi:hypothetical protein
MATRSGRPGRPRTTRILLGLAVALVAVAALVVIRRPTAEPPTQVSEPDPVPAVVNATVVVDSVDATRNVLEVRVTVEPGSEDLPPEGVTLFTSMGLTPAITFEDGQLITETVSEIPLEVGDVGDYPFDRYRGTVEWLVVPGTDETLTAEAAAAAFTDPLPLRLDVFSSAVGFELDAVDRPSPFGDLDVAAGEVVITAERATQSLVWTWAMMALYWLLALSVVAVTLSIVLGERPWESRHLAWLGAMIFAFAAFRNAAPGSPPIGVYFDFASVFPALAIVAICLVALVVYLLLDPHRDLAVDRSSGAGDG